MTHQKYHWVNLRHVFFPFFSRPVQTNHHPLKLSIRWRPPRACKLVTKHTSVTKDFFPLPSENLRPRNFTRPVRGFTCGFPGATFTYPAYIVCVFLKKAKQRPGSKGRHGGKFTDRVKLFPKTQWDYRCHSVCYRGVQQNYLLFSFCYPQSQNLTRTLSLVFNV